MIPIIFAPFFALLFFTACCYDSDVCDCPYVVEHVLFEEGESRMMRWAVQEKQVHGENCRCCK